MEKAIKVAAKGTAGYHVSIDMDWVDPEKAPGVGTPVPGGATYREAHLAMETLADDGGMLSLEAVEVNPILDEHNRTAEVRGATDLLGVREEDFLGRRVGSGAGGRVSVFEMD